MCSCGCTVFTHIGRSEESTLEVLLQALYNIVISPLKMVYLTQHVLELTSLSRMSDQQFQEYSCLHLPTIGIASPWLHA